MRNKIIMLLPSVSLVLAACSTAIESSSSEESSIVSPETSSLVLSSNSETKSSSSSKKSTSRPEGEHDFQWDLDDVLEIIKNTVDRNKSFTINEDKFIQETATSTQIPYDGESVKNSIIKTSQHQNTYSHDGENGTGFFLSSGKINDNGNKTDDNKKEVIEEKGGEYLSYSESSKSFHKVDSDYAFYSLFSSNPVVEFAYHSRLEMPYFDRYYATPGETKAWIGEDFYQYLVLKNFANQEYEEKNGIKKLVVIVGTSSTFNGPKLPAFPNGMTYITSGTFDCQYTLEIEWKDEELVSFSSVFAKSFTVARDDFENVRVLTHDSFEENIKVSFKDGMETKPTLDVADYRDLGLVQSSAVFYVPLKQGVYRYSEHTGMMGEPINLNNIISKEMVEAGIKVNIFEDEYKNRKLDPSSITHKSFNKKYYIDFVVPSKVVYVLMEQMVRTKADIAKGDFTFKSHAWTDLLSDPLASWTPEDFTVGSKSYKTAHLLLQASSDRNPNLNFDKISLRTGNYYVIQNCADEK